LNRYVTKRQLFDTATVESFLKNLKSEEVYLWEYETMADVEKRIPYFIERVYNPKRFRFPLGHLTQISLKGCFWKTKSPSDPVRSL